MRARTPPSNVQRSDPQQVPITDTAGRASWEHPRGAGQMSSGEHPSGTGRRTALLLIGGAMALVALGAFVWSQRSESARTVTPVLSATTDIAVAPRAGSETVGAAPSPSPSIRETMGKPDGAASSEGTTPSAGPGEAARAVEGSTPVREPATEVRPRRNTTPAAPMPSPAAPGKGLTDFGGRR